MILRRLPLAVACLLAGCAVLVDRSYTPLSEASVELTGVPFYAQERYQCGPAALATVLEASGVAASAEELAPEVFVPDRRGALQLELVSGARRRERLPVVIEGDAAGVVRQLEAGRPVLVLQNLGYRRLPRWHYAVVVGYEPAEDRFVLRSGTTERLLMPRHRFETSWERADRWGMVLFAPGETPDGVGQIAYLQAAAGLESVGRHQSALQAFDSALKRWPDAPLALLGRANNLYALERRGEAEAAYRRLLEVAPENPAGVHNLVTLLVEQRRPCEAAALLSSVDHNADSRLSALAAQPELAACPGR